jgi:hypothetical protein
MRNRFLLGLVLLLISGVALFGQSVAGLGAISGTVRDASGAAVPNAQVVVANESKGIRRSLTTTDAGVFAAPSLVPSMGYSVTVSASGFSNYEIKDVQVTVGQNVALDIDLAVAGTTTQVQVEAVAPIVDATKTDVSQVVGSAEIQDLPINGRRVDSFVLLAPAVVPDGTFGLISFRGVAGGNTFLTDGNDTTNQYYNENAGRTRIQSQIGQDAVQEFQVVSNNYSAEFGHAMGGVVNTVTRSGSNAFHGTSYWFFRNQNFNATDIFATVDPATGKRINPLEKRNQFGVSAGGKIIKDKLFYFVNYEGLWRDFPLIASMTASGSSLFNTSGQFIATGGAPATAAQCDTARAFLNRQFQTVARTANQNLGFMKFDWRPTESHSISVSLNLLRWVSPNGLQTQAVLNNGNGVGNNVNSSVRAKYGRIAWTAIPTPTMVNEFRFGWFNDKQYDYPNSELGIPGIGFVGMSITGQSNLGTAVDYPRKNPLENRYSYADTLTWTSGKHTLKFGADLMFTNDLTDLLFNRTGTYSWASWSNLAADFSNNGGAKNWQTFTQTIGNPVVKFTIPDYAFFVQDQYKLTPRFTLNIGLRYDYSALPQPTVTNPDYAATGRIPTTGTNFAPRIGFAYALDAQSKTVVRAGYGMFHGRYPGGLINTLMLGNGVYQKSITLTGSVASDRAGGPSFPNVLPTNSSSYNPPAGSVSLNMASKDFRAPYTQQADIAIERQLDRTTAVTVSGIWSRGLHLTSVNDINIGAPGPTVTYNVVGKPGDPSSTFTYSTPVYVRQNRVDTRYNRLNVIDAGLNSWYNGLTAQLTKRYAHGISGGASYTWSHSIDLGQGSAGTPNIFASGGPQSYAPGDYRGMKGSSSLDVRHRLVVNAMWTPTCKIDNAARYIVNGWGLSVLGTFQSAPASTPVVSLSSAYVPTGYTVAQSGSTLNGYGGSTIAPFLPLTSVPIAPVTRFDLRLNKSVTFKERYKAIFSFDAFNVANHTYFTSINTRAYVYSLVSNVPTLTYQSALGTGTAAQGFPDGTNSRRLQLGLRFIW